MSLALAIAILALNTASLIYWRREYIQTRETRIRLEKMLGGSHG